jgi:adenylate kinase family enzyme
MNQKWINEGGVFYPISGNLVLHVTPGPGVYEIVQPGAPTDRRIGLNKLYDKFEFRGKFYNVCPKKLNERIKKVWDSDYFRDNKKSLGVILNGLKGSGKTWTAKQIANEMDMPVLIVDNSFDGDILNFIRSLNFSCTILVDEAEKIFKLGEDDDVLLRIIDNAGSNISRHLFILTTNTLDVNQNLIGRTGRIRYLINFRNLPEDVVKEYIDDNLDPKLGDKVKEEIIEKVNLLEYNSIDLLRSIIEEVNIIGSVDSSDDEMMNIPLSKYAWDVLDLEGADWKQALEVKKFYYENNPGKLPFVEWLSEIYEKNGDDEITMEDAIDRKISGVYTYRKRMTSRYSRIWKDFEVSCGTVICEPDGDGFFSYLDNYTKDEHISVVLKQKSCTSLYNRGIL